ncbi:YczE/YyaS/YitT family protein [Sporolactobacillus laevolacticus]|uniref:YczE/YyaS/YitT family protein n=1 Tax=Sporolactobacillus laevolacticus TaxID=33018 RepID=UPI0025B52253|nr:membrane protein [Sporolactobacillus laevolacticus]MDN3955540.1 membrane protein [Sporolactobacillus laevolacticus]
MTENLNNPHRWLEMFLKSILSFIGVAILAIGAMLCKEGNVGLDPFTALNIGVSGKIHLSLGTYQLLTNVFIIIFVILLDRKKIGIGTIINMVFAGFMIDWFSAFYNTVFHYHPTFLTGIVNGILGLLLFTLGTSLYMTANLGVAPYDALAPIASNRLHIKYKYCRMVQDIGFMIAALIMGGPIGLATIIISFFAGPLITFWDNHVSDNLVNTLVEFSKNPSGRKIGHGFDIAGKSTYNLVKHSYNHTVEIQEKLSHYSDQQLQQKEKQIRRTLKDARIVLKNSIIQYGLVKKEERRRERAENHESYEKK